MRTVRYAFRTLFKSPFVTTVAIISLALGIGANAAIFSLFNQMLLQPLPVHEPEGLVNLAAAGPKPGSQTCNQAGDCDAVFSYAMFRDLQADPRGFTGLAAHRAFDANVAYEGQTLSGEAMAVSGTYFPLLGVQPSLGRLLGPADDETIGAHPVVVLGHGFWETHLGSDQDIVGRPIIVNGTALTVIGVAPRGFQGTTLGARPDLYVPISMYAAVNPGWDQFENRRSYWAYVFGRLQPGTSMAQAGQAINLRYRAIVNDVEVPLQTGMTDETLQRFRTKEITLEEGRRGQSSVHAEVRTPMLLLFATAGVVLLIACANIANLLLARGANRGMEMAVRLSLGANRRQVLTQLLTESVLLGLMGGLAGLLVADWTLAMIGSLLPAEAADTLALQLAPASIAFAAVLAIATGLLFGLFPAMHSTRSDLVTTIRSNAGNLTVTRGAARFRATLVTAQIALSMALLIMAGLFLRSLTNISRVDLGMQTEGIIAFAVSPELNGYDIPRAQALFERIEEELRAQPGVTGVTSSMIRVLSGNNWGTDVHVEGFERAPDADANARFNEIGAGYFATMSVPLIAGREFTLADRAGASKVAIVNEAFAKKFNLGRDAVGKMMSSDGEELDMQIVGLVKDAKYSEVKAEIPPLFFIPWRQDERIGFMNFYVRTAIDPAQVMRAVPGVIARLDPNLPVEELKSLPQQVRENVFLDRMIGTMSAAFAGLATLLAAVGLYGVLAYTVERRTREIGVRMALGADRGRVQRMVLRQVGFMLMAGGVIGVGAALVLGRAAGSLLYGVDGNDPVTIVFAVALLTLFALAAGYIPALRASRVDPLSALRYD